MILVAVSRSGERLKVSPREIELQPGDTLLLECPPKGQDTTSADLNKSLDFFDSEDAVVYGKKSLLAGIILIAMVLLQTLNIIPLVTACMLAAMAMVVFRCCTPKSAQKSIEWDILMIVASSVVFGQALQQNGVSDIIAGAVHSVAGTNHIFMLFIICGMAMILSEFLTDNVTSAVLFPVVYETATLAGFNPLPFCMALMLSVTFTFVSPLSSVVNMTTFGAGGYKLKHFVKIGLPLDLIMWVSIVFIVTLIYPFH